MRRGFTLIEVLVTVAVIALLAAILLPSLAAARTEGKRTVCLGNLKQLALATGMYLDSNQDYFWRYYTDSKRPKGRRWWFGFEPNGPATGQRLRPLDKTQGVLAHYLRSTNDGLQCPSFPYDEGGYFPKFAARSASYGFNLELGPANPLMTTRRRSEFRARISTVFVFADGAHFDYSPGMNEGHYIDYVPDPTDPNGGGGFGHYRHRGRAEVLYIDGHAEGQLLRGPACAGPAIGGLAGNLTDSAGGSSIYGF